MEKTIKRTVIKSSEHLLEESLLLGSNIAFDTETTGLDYMKLDIEGFSVCDGKMAFYVDLIGMEKSELDSCMFILGNILGAATNIIGHNIVFDMKVIKKYGISLEGKRIYCTMIADHLIDETRPHGLKHLAEVLLGKEVTKYEEAEKAGHQSELFYEYAINDALWTYELCIYQQPFLKEQELMDVFRNIEMPFQFVLLDMETNGMQVDVKEVTRLRGIMKEAVENLTMQMHDMLGLRVQFQTTFDEGIQLIPAINLSSSHVIAKILFETLGLDIIEKTGLGAPKTGKETINAYKKSVPFVALLHRYKIYQKLLSAYFSEGGQIMRNLDEDGRVRPNFRDTGTQTGRLSCNNPNLQQLPKNNCWKCGDDKIEGHTCQTCGSEGNYASRTCFIAGEGRTMITCDYAGQEIRVMAEISKDPTLIEALSKGHDMHLAVANQFYKLGIPEECLVDTHPEHGKWKKKFKAQRTQAKTITFGLAYGKGAFGFAKDFGVTEIEAQKIVDDYFAGMPKLLDAIDASHEEVDVNGHVTYMSGRKRHFEKVTMNGWTGYTKASYRKAFNAKIQGYSADMMRIAMIRVREEALKHPQYDLRMEAAVHDEIVLTVKDKYKEEAKALIKREMEDAVHFCVPIKADLGEGPNYEIAK
jgi:DNA polymerase-1